MAEDLSKLAKNSLWPTSQAGGNMLANSDEAMTAPGSQPVDNLQNHLSQVREEPAAEMGEPSDDARHLVNDDGDGGGTADAWSREWKNPRGTDWGVSHTSRRER